MARGEGGPTVLIAMAGLPGTGKSTLAACLERELEAVVLDKDRVRAALFPPRVLDYSEAQNDIAMAAIYRAAAAILRADPRQTVILDGRTFLRSSQVRELLELASALGETPRLVECVCDDAVARERLDRDKAQGSHPAGNRTFALYRLLQTAAEPITLPRLVLDTARLSLVECVQRCLDYLGAAADPHP
jgi:predicted kinase